MCAASRRGLISFFILHSSFFILLVSCGKPAEQTLGDWKKSADSSRDRFVEAYFPKDPKFIKKCITKMSELPNTEKVRAMDAGQSCLMGLELKERNAAAAKKNAN
ncbi:MAG: hypothetical protein LBQ49_02475 [Rickettsiales bacterium]|jgi:hypothetical protein|nr:hypothetical protein [Rickettsiales bacterium]